jgi:hypothetical protein
LSLRGIFLSPAHHNLPGNQNTPPYQRKPSVTPPPSPARAPPPAGQAQPRSAQYRRQIENLPDAPYCRGRADVVIGEEGFRTTSGRHCC